MAWSRIFASVACLVLICSTARVSFAAPVNSVVFAAPAGIRPAGPLSASQPFARVLPSGRLLRPTGKNVVVGTNALGLALTPDGRYAIVSNDDEDDAQAVSLFDGATPGGYSLSVVSTATMRVVYRYRAVGESFFVGLLALRDPANPANTLVLASGGPANTVYAFDLDAAGRLTADAKHTIPIPVVQNARLANDGRAFPATLVAAAGGSRAYVVDNLGNAVVTLDVARRAVIGAAAPVGYFPLAAALAPDGLLVANEGLMEYGVLPAPALAPPFSTPSAPLDQSSSLSLLAMGRDGTLGAAPAAAVPMDRAPDGLHDAGGAHPAAIVTMHARPYAFVAMSNVDRIATVALGPQPRVAGGTELRLYDRGPYGTQPSALALGPDDRHLYVALAGIDAVAVLDTTEPARPHRIGLIPTGWYPTALALSRDGRYLYVANTKGYGEDAGRVPPGRSNGPVWSTLERIDLRTVDLHRTTPRALALLRTLAPARASRVVPQERVGMQSTYVKHVVVLSEASASYDAVLGDLTDAAGARYGPGDPAYAVFGASVTPNLHALARTFGLAGNFYADAEEANAGQQFAGAGIASVFTERTVRVNAARGAYAGANQDPEDYPRAGYIFNSLATRGLSFRDYGAFLRVSGYDGGVAQPFPAQASGLGGLYSLDVPALGVLGGHVDLNYPGWNPQVLDVTRAEEFERDFDPLVKADRMPAFTYVRLPGERDASGPAAPALAERVADGDRALGQIVDYLTHQPQWSSTAIFIVPSDASANPDHVNGHRSYAIVVSPYAKHRYLGSRHLSTAGALKTEEEMLGLSALSLGDALATDMSDFFTTVPDLTPYSHIDAAVQAADRAGRFDARAR